MRQVSCLNNSTSWHTPLRAAAPGHRPVGQPDHKLAEQIDDRIDRTGQHRHAAAAQGKSEWGPARDKSVRDKQQGSARQPLR